MTVRPRRRLWRPGLLLALVLGVAALLQGGMLPAGARPMEVAGQAQVVDGDTLVIGEARIRLNGIDAPEARQSCERDGAPWACGAEAARARRDRLHARHIACVAEGQDRWRRTLARCFDGDADIAAWMVQEGWAVAYTRYSWRYMPQELGARLAGRGIWSGRFEAPEDWRRHAN
jgi:endonuclease YncB( thermonuclease family)